MVMNTKSQMRSLKLPTTLTNTMPNMLPNMIHHFKTLKPLWTPLKMHYLTLCYPIQMANNHTIPGS